MTKIYKENRLEIPPESRTGGPTNITDILNRMFYVDYYEKIEADQAHPVNLPDSPKSTVNNGGMINEKS